MGAQSLARFTGGAHSDAVPTFLETLEREAEDPATCAASDCARSPGSRGQDLGDFRTRPDADGPPAAAGPTGPGELRRSGREHPGLRTPRHRRTRKDPFEGVWCDVLLWLQKDPDTNAKDPLARHRSAHPGRFSDAQLRTL